MSKVILLGDTHIGMRGDSVAFIEHQKNFYNNVLFPYCETYDIKHIYQVGDLFDKRQSINFRTLYESKKFLFEELKKRKITFTTLVGNHDMYYLDSLQINASDLLLKEYFNINVVTKPTTEYIGTCSIDLIPWICKENYEEVTEFIKNSKSDYCAGHFEIAGFPMYKGMVSDHGLSPAIFNKYKKVWSGHYHTRSENKNIEYIGTPMEITWMDCEDPRGFVVFDTANLTQEFVPNEYTIFEKITYDQETFNHKSFNYSSLKNKYVKIIILNKENVVKYDSFLQKIYESGCHDVTIVENFEELTSGTVDDNVVIENTIDVVNSYIDSIDVTGNKEKLKELMQSLYIRAINEEV